MGVSQCPPHMPTSAVSCQIFDNRNWTFWSPVLILVFIQRYFVPFWSLARDDKRILLSEALKFEAQFYGSKSFCSWNIFFSGQKVRPNETNKASHRWKVWLCDKQTVLSITSFPTCCILLALLCISNYIRNRTSYEHIFLKLSGSHFSPPAFYSWSFRWWQSSFPEQPGHYPLFPAHFGGCFRLQFPVKVGF